MESLPEQNHLSDIPKIDTLTHGKPIHCFSASRGENGSIMVCFDFNGHHLEAEIFNETGVVEAFYLNRNTDATWEDSTNIWSEKEWKEKLKNG